MKIIIFVSFAFLFCQASFADQVTYTTTTGAVFNQVDNPAFGKVWRSPDGLVWSSNIGKFSNKPQTPITNGEIKDSPAANACRQIGGRLPTVQEYLTLTSYFDMKPGGVLISDLGRIDLFAVFPDVRSHNFWSSTINGGGGIFYVFYDNGVINCWSKKCVNANRSVRCVTK